MTRFLRTISRIASIHREWIGLCVGYFHLSPASKVDAYERYVKSQEHFIDKSTDNEVKSIISKVSGKIINVDYVSTKDNNQVCKIFFGGQALTAGSSGTVELTESNNVSKNQLFEKSMSL